MFSSAASTSASRSFRLDDTLQVCARAGAHVNDVRKITPSKLAEGAQNFTLHHAQSSIEAGPRSRTRLTTSAGISPWAQTIVLAHPGDDDSEFCGDCGGVRVV